MSAFKRFEGTIKLVTDTGDFHHTFAGGSVDSYKALPDAVARALTGTVKALIDDAYEKQLKEAFALVDKLKGSIDALNAQSDKEKNKKKVEAEKKKALDAELGAADKEAAEKKAAKPNASGGKQNDPPKPPKRGLLASVGLGGKK